MNGTVASTDRMKLIFFGSGEFGIPTLAALHQYHDLRLAVTQPDRPAGRKRLPTPTPIAAWCAEHGIPTIRTDDANTPDVIEHIQREGPDAAVVIAFGQKLSPDLIAACGRLAVNLHSSLLPKYRGAAPIHWAMIRGESHTGVSVIGLAQRMDAGAIYATRATPIDPRETAGELHDRLAALGPDAVLGVLNDLQHNRLDALPQDHSAATPAPKLSKADGTVLFDQPARHLRQRIHGLTPWPGCRVSWAAPDGAEKGTLFLRRVADEHASDGDTKATPGTVLDDLRVATAHGVLRLLELQAPGTPIMPADAFARGHGLSPGDRLGPLHI